jgi:hypothetical protein
VLSEHILRFPHQEVLPVQDEASDRVDGDSWGGRRCSSHDPCGPFRQFVLLITNK